MQIYRKFTACLSLGLILILSACVTDTRGGHALDNAIKDGDWDRASNIYTRNESYFKSNFRTYHPQLSIIAEELNKQFDPKLSAASQNLNSIDWPLSEVDWPYAAKQIIKTEELLGSYQEHRVLMLSGFQSPYLGVLNNNFERLKNIINESTNHDFMVYDHFGTKSFFNAYPKKLNATRFMTENYHLIKDDITKADQIDLEHFIENYPLGKVLTGEADRHVRSAYLNALTTSKTAGGELNLLEAWNILQSASTKGMDTKKIARDRFLIMEVPSNTRLFEDAIGFPMSLKADIAFNHRRANIENIMKDRALKRAEYIVIVDVAASKYSIIENNVNTVSSTYYSHSKYTTNPAYRDAKIKVKNAREKLQQAQDDRPVEVKSSRNKKDKSKKNKSDVEALASILNVILSSTINNGAIENAEQDLKEAEEHLDNTPRQIETKQYASYDYLRVSVKATKEISINYFVIDKASKKYVRGNLTRKVNKHATLLKNTRSDDPNLSTLTENTMDDKTFQTWLESPVDIKVSEIINDYKSRHTSAGRLPADVLVQQDLFDQRNQYMRRFSSTNKIDYKPTASSSKVPTNMTEIGYGRVAEFDFPRGPVQPNSFAVVIGVKNYEDRDVPNVDFALNDADAIKQFLIKTRGFKESNVIILEDPRQSQLLSYFGTETNYQGKLYDIVTREDIDQVFVYFSGHGIPTKSGSGVMLPSDADPLKPEFTGYKLETMIQNLNKLPNVQTVLAVDSCFSGISDGGTLIKDASPIFISAQTNRLGLDNGVVFTAADGSEIASWDRDLRMGLFTRHLLEGYAGKADLNQNGKIEVFEMEKHLKNAVGRDANRRYSRQQTPQTVGKANLTLNSVIDPYMESLDQIMHLAN